MKPLRILVPALLIGWLAIPLPGADPAAKQTDAVSYYRQVRPLFQQHCQGCHQPARAKGAFVMTSHAELLKKGESDKPGIVPGKPEQSLVVQQVLPQADKGPAMPPNKPPLKDHEVALIKKWIAQGAADDTPMAARRVVDADHPPTYDLPSVVTGLDYSPDGSLLAVSGFHEVLLHKADGSELVGRLVGLSERIQSVAFSPDGARLATAGGSASRFGEVQIWDMKSKKLQLSVTVTHDTLSGISWSGDGALVAFGCADNTVRALDTMTGKEVLYQGAHTDWALGTTFSLKSTHVISVSRDMSLKLTELATQRFIDNITSITPGALKGGLMSVQRHPAKEEVLVGGSDGVPKIYRIFRDPKQPRQIGDDFNLVRAFPAMPGRIFAVRYSADGQRIVAGSSLAGRGKVRIYKEADAQQAARWESATGGIYAVAFHPQGQQVAAAGFDGVVRILDAKTGKPVKEFVPVPLNKQ